jgi:hypothetical protein
MKAKVKPSWIDENFWLSSAVISAALRERSLNGSRVKNTTPLFGVLVNCSGFSPGKATSWATPSTPFAIAAIFFSAASVRSIEAPSGIFTRRSGTACPAPG